MARKLRKVPRNPTVILIELLIPWAVMALVAVALTEMGLKSEAAIGLALASALGMNGLVFLYERLRRKRALARVERSSRK